MVLIRVPYPDDPVEREALFARAAAKLSRHGSYQGTSEAGTFHGRTPIGAMAGTYRSPAGSGTLEITLTKKPRLLPTTLIEHELRRFLAHL